MLNHLPCKRRPAEKRLSPDFLTERAALLISATITHFANGKSAKLKMKKVEVVKTGLMIRYHSPEDHKSRCK